MKLLLSIIGFSLIAGLLALKCCEFDEAYLAVDHLLSKNNTLIPNIVRLSFHDCLGQSCDGCLNLNFHTNFGLEESTTPLNELYHKGFYKVMSRADFWQLAGHVALVRGGLNQQCDSYGDEGCPFFHNQYHWGRRDCPSSPDYHSPEDGGNANGDFEELRRILTADFDLADDEIVTILGAHALGGAARHDSGFVLNWQKKELTFDNQYFKNMVTLPYSHVDIAQGQRPKPRKEFITENGHPPVMMLNTDMSLWKHLKAIKDEGGYTGDVRCPMKGDMKVIPNNYPNFHDECKDADTAEQVEAYASDVQLFFNDFPAVYQKMVSNGYEHLSKPVSEEYECGYCIPEGAYCRSGFRHSGSCCKHLHCHNNICVP